MDIIIRFFDTHAEADEAAARDNSGLATGERLADFLELRETIFGLGQRLERTLRTRNLNESDPDRG